MGVRGRKKRGGEGEIGSLTSAPRSGPVPAHVGNPDGLGGDGRQRACNPYQLTTPFSGAPVEFDNLLRLHD